MWNKWNSRFRKKIYKNSDKKLFEHNVEEIQHRGPDDFDFGLIVQLMLGFGFQRLSIQDLTINGNQPMMSICKRYVIIFNGEIYNFKELKQKFEFKGVKFKSNSDTEVLLYCITSYGIEKSLNLINGMFAFALWDMKEKILHLVRDRIGEKPLYYGWQNNVFIFSSELKALKKFPNFKADICKSALQLQLNYSYIPAPYSIFKNIYKLMPGNFISLKINSNFTDKNIKNTCYWYPKDKILKNKKILISLRHSINY